MSSGSIAQKLRAVVVLAVVAVVCVQVYGVTVVSIPPESAPPAARSLGLAVIPAYLEEEWKLFAPNPVGLDRNLLVQAAWRDGDTVVEGEWLDLTAIDNTVVAHAVGAPRSAYLTSRMAGAIDASWANAGNKVKAAVRDESSPEEPLSVDDLREALLAAEATERAAEVIGDFDLATVTYATDAVRTLEPDHGELVAVRYATRVSSVPKWQRRDVQDKTGGSIAAGPWRLPAQDDPDRRAAVASYLERHR
ncbi:MAG: DUF5819 family protein [Aeromicrobium sp.]|uniref:DUF5819 family protein n=1 Tax=Aeromicrobium sp. TaxID=1871063 RepID=UPI0039E65A69